MVFRFLFCYIATKTIFLILTLQKLKALVLYIAPLVFTNCWLYGLHVYGEFTDVKAT